MLKRPVQPNSYRYLLDQAIDWFREHGYTVGLPFVWDYGKTRSDFRVLAPGSEKEVAVIFLHAAKPERLAQWLNIQRKPGVYVITELGMLALVISCDECHNMTHFEFLAALRAPKCYHAMGVEPKTLSVAEQIQEQLDFLYYELDRAPDVRYPNDLDQGMKLVRDNYYEIKPLHFGRVIGMTASELRKLIQSAGGFPAHDKVVGRTEKIWRIPRRYKPGPEPQPTWTFDEEPL